MNSPIKPAAVILAMIFFSFCAAFVSAQTGELEQRHAVTLKRVVDPPETNSDKGAVAIREKPRSESPIEFRKLAEVFMISDVMARENQKLSECFGQLIENANRIELADDKQLQNARNLPQSCGRNADGIQAKAVTSLVSNQAAGEDSLKGQRGSSEKELEPAPLDEIAKRELIGAEQKGVNSSEAHVEHQQGASAPNTYASGFSFQMHPMVQQFIGYYQGRGRSTMETGLHRSGMFMLMARKIFREEGVQENVAWLGQVESAWKPTATSWAAASGLWQFIPGTGSRFGLRRTAYVDERNSFEKATRASARYLKFLFNRYGGNWELAMAAYNSGEGNVDRAIRRAGVANFWVAYPYLPKETRNYVPNILATILIANDPNRYGFGHVRPAPRLHYDLVRVPALTKLHSVAKSSDTTVEYIRYLNPELRSNVTPPEPYIIRIPAGKVSQVTATHLERQTRNVKPQKPNRLAGL